MELNRPFLVVTFELSERRKAIVADVLAGAGEERGFAYARIARFRAPPNRLYEGRGVFVADAGT